MEVIRLSDRRPAGRHRFRTGRRSCPGTPRFSTPVPTSVEAPDLARMFTQVHLCEYHGAHTAGAVSLLVGELVTHSLLYGAPPIVVTLECEVTQVRLTVTDGSPGLATPESEHRYLSWFVVDSLAGDWGLESGPHGETFWCTVPTRLS